MTLAAAPRDWRRLAMTLGGESLQSGLHFALNLALMAMLPPKDYGAFAFALVMGGVGLYYIRSLAAMPASTYIGRARRVRFADFYEGAFGAAALAIGAVIALSAGLALAAFSEGPAWSGGAMVGLWSLRSHLRTVGYARRRPAAVLAGDAAFAVVGALASALALSVSENRLRNVLLALALANLVGSATMALARRAAPRFDFGARARAFYFTLCLRLVWSLYSVTATILQGHGVSFMVVGFAGPAAYAPIAAMLAFFAPMRILSLSLANMLQPEVSRVAAQGDEAGWREMRYVWTLRAGLIATAYGELGLLVLPRLHLQSFGHQPVAPVAVAAWALYAVALGYFMPRLLMESRLRFRQIAAITTVGAGFTLASTAILLSWTAPAYAIFGATLGEALVAAATWVAAARPLTDRRPASMRFTPQGAAPAKGVACEAEPSA